MHFDSLVPRRVAAEQFDLAAPAIKLLSKQPDESLVRGRIHRRRSHLNPQFIACRLANLVA